MVEKEEKEKHEEEKHKEEEHEDTEKALVGYFDKVTQYIGVITKNMTEMREKIDGLEKALEDLRKEKEKKEEEEHKEHEDEDELKKAIVQIQKELEEIKKRLFELPDKKLEDRDKVDLGSPDKGKFEVSGVKDGTSTDFISGEGVKQFQPDSPAYSGVEKSSTPRPAQNEGNVVPADIDIVKAIHRGELTVSEWIKKQMENRR